MKKWKTLFLISVLALFNSCSDEETFTKPAITIEDKFEITNHKDILNIVFEGTAVTDSSAGVCTFTKNSVLVNIRVTNYSQGIAFFTLIDTSISAPEESPILYDAALNKNLNIETSIGNATNYSFSAENFTGKILIDIIANEIL
jgi:hypothetical protein